MTCRWENALLVADVIDDIALNVPLGGAGNAHRLVECNVNARLFRFERLAVHAYVVALGC